MLTNTKFGRLIVQVFHYEPQFNDSTFNDSSPPVFLAIRSMSAIGSVCHLSLAPSAATRFPPSIIIAVIVLPDRRQFRRSPRNTCSE
jgi:hypothetical protein